MEGTRLCRGASTEEATTEKRSRTKREWLGGSGRRVDGGGGNRIMANTICLR